VPLDLADEPWSVFSCRSLEQRRQELRWKIQLYFDEESMRRFESDAEIQLGLAEHGVSGVLTMHHWLGNCGLADMT
jgi:hypothetical protein